ncbi:MAG: hypothetical protein ACKN9U_14280, partial [Pirellulaceae bacterium]
QEGEEEVVLGFHPSQPPLSIGLPKHSTPVPAAGVFYCMGTAFGTDQQTPLSLRGMPTDR